MVFENLETISSQSAMPMPSGQYVHSPQEFVDDCYELAVIVAESGFRPDYVAAMCRGGAFPAAVIHEFLHHVLKMRVTYLPILTSAYTPRNKRGKKIKIWRWSLEALTEVAAPDRKFLFVDDLQDSRGSFNKVLRVWKKRVGERFPREIRLAVLDYKDTVNGTPPNYYVRRIPPNWVVYPHEKENFLDGRVPEGLKWRIDRLLRR